VTDRFLICREDVKHVLACPSASSGPSRRGAWNDPAKGKTPTLSVNVATPSPPVVYAGAKSLDSDSSQQISSVCAGGVTNKTDLMFYD
jgi:hypothetical protein